MQRRDKFDLAHFSGPLRSRVISFFQSGTINFSTLIEQEAIIHISKDIPDKPQLTVMSFIAKFRLSLTTREAYAKVPQPNYKTHLEPNHPILIKGKHGWSVNSSPHGYECYRLELPRDLDKREIEKLQKEESEFLMLKYWLHIPDLADGRAFRVWALLILWRDGGCAIVVHDRQGSGIGQSIAVGSRNGRPVGRSQYIAQNTQNGVASTVTNVV
jgi:hypothetical protein